jgi:hypothetical protein
LGNPEKELEEFLASLPVWMRRTLQEGFPALTQAERQEWANNFEEIFRRTKQYEHILQQIPAKYRKYRARLKREFRQTSQFEAQFLIPKGKPGAPRKDDLAQQAEHLHQQGRTFPQIAAELNKKLGKDENTSAEAVRKLLKRRSQPDKT